MNYTDDQIDTAAETMWEASKGQGLNAQMWNWDELHDDVRTQWRIGMRAALDTLTPAEDPALIRWIPADGPLADKLAGLPEGHPFSVTYKARVVHRNRGESTYVDVDRKYATSASWLPAVPAWDGALAIKTGNGYVGVLLPDGSYDFGRYGILFTLRDIVYDPITVLIDAAGHHVGADQ